MPSATRSSSPKREARRRRSGTAELPVVGAAPRDELAQIGATLERPLREAAGILGQASQGVDGEIRRRDDRGAAFHEDAQAGTALPRTAQLLGLTHPHADLDAVALGDHGIGAVNLSAIDTYAESLRDKLGL